MELKFKTDGKPIVIDTANIQQFYAVAVGKSVIEHIKDGNNIIDIVNHSLIQITESLCLYL